MPRIEQLQQNTPDWQLWRQQGLGASDAPVIMGDSAFKTPRQLWSIKTGRNAESCGSPAARRGHELEQFARRAYEARMKIQMEPACLVHDRFDWMRSDEHLEAISRRLDEFRAIPVVTPQMVAALSPVDARSYKAGLLGANRAGLWRPPRSESK
jgi:hypothetical protein